MNRSEKPKDAMQTAGEKQAGDDAGPKRPAGARQQKRLALPRTRNRFLFGAVAIVALVAGYKAYVQFVMEKNQGLEPFFQALERDGYVANRNISGLFYPGNVIQVKAERDGKEYVLPTPQIFRWHDKCFPGVEPKADPVTFPVSSGKSATSLVVGADLLDRILPDLHFESSAVAKYTLVLKGQHTLTIERAAINRQMSPECAESFDTAIRLDGDRLEWFKVILQVVAADQLELELNWQENTAATVKASIRAEAEKKLADTVRQVGPGTGPSDTTVGLKAESERRTVISASGLVILGYKTNEKLEPVCLPKQGRSGQ